jgi:hypothetical protein
LEWIAVRSRRLVARNAGGGVMPGRLMKVPLQISCRQDDTVPSLAVPAAIRTTPAVPSGAHDSSSARDHTTWTCLPGTASASSAASIAASSAPLWP